MANRLNAASHQIRQNNPEIANILDVFSEIECVYGEIQEAMGITIKNPTSEVINSANISLLTSPNPSTSTIQKEAEL